MIATANFITTISTRCRISFRTGRKSLDSIHLSGWWITWFRRGADAVRILAADFRRMVAQCGRRTDAADLGLCFPPGAAQRKNWVRSHADRRTESKRYQRRGRGPLGRVVPGRAL